MTTTSSAETLQLDFSASNEPVTAPDFPAAALAPADHRQRGLGAAAESATSAPTETVVEAGSIRFTLADDLAVSQDRPAATNGALAGPADFFKLVDSPSTGGVAVATTAVTRPRFYYGWWMLGLSMVAAIATSPGQTFGVSIFNEPLRQELGLTHGQLALAYMLGTLFGAVPITWFGRLMDRFGIRPVTLGVVLAFAFACGTVSLAHNWYTLVVAFTLLRMLGPGALSLMSANVLPFWFHRRLGTVEGFRQTAMAVAMAVIPGLNLWLVLEFGWRGAYVLLAASLLLLWPLFWFGFRNHPEELGHNIDGDPDLPQSAAGLVKNRRTLSGFSLPQVLRTATFWSALINGSLYSLIHTGVFFCLVPILAEQGLDAKYSAWMLMVFAISLAINQMLGGWLADRLHPARQMFGGQLLFSLGLALLYWGGGVRETLIAGGIMGAAQGYFFAASNPIWARYYGLKHLGAIRGFLMSFHVALSSIGPLLVGWCHDLFGDFNAILLAFAGLPCLFSMALFLIREPGPKPTG